MSRRSPPGARTRACMPPGLLRPQRHKRPSSHRFATCAELAKAARASHGTRVPRESLRRDEAENELSH